MIYVKQWTFISNLWRIIPSHFHIEHPPETMFWYWNWRLFKGSMGCLIMNWGWTSHKGSHSVCGSNSTDSGLGVWVVVDEINVWDQRHNIILEVILVLVA
jgi:hypothetical protein